MILIKLNQVLADFNLSNRKLQQYVYNNIVTPKGKIADKVNAAIYFGAKTHARNAKLMENIKKSKRKVPAQYANPLRPLVLRTNLIFFSF